MANPPKNPIINNTPPQPTPKLTYDDIPKNHWLSYEELQGIVDMINDIPDD